MSASTWAVLVEENGKTYVVELVDQQQKIKGLGVFNPHQALHNTPIGQSVVIGQKELKRMPARLPELSRGMVRRAQTIGSKDAGFSSPNSASVRTMPCLRLGLEAVDYRCTFNGCSAKKAFT